MSCNHCDSKFGLLRKELGCSNCGLSLCSKCLRQKCAIPSKGPGEYRVCRVCYNKLSKGSETIEPIIPPDRFVRRLENMDNSRASHPITVYKNAPAKSEVSVIDQEIADRLKQLKAVSHPSDKEIQKKLVQLKVETIGMFQKPVYTLAELQYHYDKVNEFLDQFASQHSIVRTSQSIDAILAQKLAALKGEEHRKNHNTVNQFEELDSEEEVDRITKQIVSEVSLDERCPIGSSKKANDDVDVRSSSPDLPWCVLCNNDATFKCLDCDGDLYCTSCNAEVHQKWGDTDHNVVPFKPE